MVKIFKGKIVTFFVVFTLLVTGGTFTNLRVEAAAKKSTKKITLRQDTKTKVKVSGVLKIKNSNKKIATISKKGVVKAKKVGVTTIKLKTKNKQSIKLKVVVKPSPLITPPAKNEVVKIEPNDESLLPAYVTSEYTVIGDSNCLYYIFLNGKYLTIATGGEKISYSHTYGDTAQIEQVEK